MFCGMSAFLFFVCTAVSWATPDRVAHSFSAGTAVTDIKAYEDGDWLSAVVDGEVWLLDVRTWQSESIASVCEGSSTASTAFYTDGSTLSLYVGCDDGHVDVVDFDGAMGSWSIASDDTATSMELGSAALDVQTYGGTVYVLTESSSGGNIEIRSIDPSSRTVNDASTYTVATTATSYQDAGLNDITGQYYVMHSTSNVSVVTLASGALTSNTASVGGDGSDIAVFDSMILMAAGNQGVLSYTAGNQIQIALNTEEMSDVVALGAHDQNTGLVVADASSQSLLLYEMDTGFSSINGALVDSIPYTAEGVPLEMVDVDRGYTFVATDAGEVLVLTENPWVSFSTSASAYTTVAVGEDITLDFSADTDGSWSLQVGEDGTVLDSGELEADVPVSSTVSITDGLLSEGRNEFWVVVTDSAGISGHAAYAVTIDEPPAQVVLTEDGVGIGSGRIIISFDGVDAEDLERYDIYVSVQPFDAEDYASSGSGGPSFCVTTSAVDSGDTGAASSASECDSITQLDVPVAVSATPGASVDVEIEGVDNGRTYYVAVRAVDAGGLEGPMSAVQSVVPQKTYSAAELAGESGGFCGSPIRQAAILAILGGVFSVMRRRKMNMFAMATMSLAWISTPAQAEDMAGAKERPSPWAHGSQIQMGSMSFADESLTTVYGTSGNFSLRLAQSVSFRHIVELGAETGLSRGKGTKLTSDGGTSSEEVRMSMLPISAMATLRLDFFENQPIVPYASAGLDTWLWRESWETDLRLITENAIGGGKLGYHWAVGGQILLDIFDRKQASAVEARRGISDTYVTFEYRENNSSAFDSEGLLFDGQQLSAGLRFDY